MSDSVDRVFVHALNTVKQIPRTGSARPPEIDRLKLYGLYKQSMEGDVTSVMARPKGGSKDGVSELEKWDAWQSNAGLTKTEAKRQYITTLINTMHRYAITTPESRELVAELEFVWDQIKSNSTSSSASSPGQLAKMRGDQQGPSDNDKGGLRMLRPLSEGDEEEEEEDDTGEGADMRTGAFGRGDTIDPPIPGDQSQIDWDVRNRKWRKRVEQALVKMTVEVAALREQLEAQRSGGTLRRRGGFWAWTLGLAWACLRHVIIDATLLGLLILWAKSRKDPMAEQTLQMLFSWIRLQITRLIKLRPARLIKQS